MNKREQGAVYEAYALEFLNSKGYTLIEKNYFTKFGEIDLILKKDNLIIFTEVKQRSSDYFGYGEHAISYTKQKRMFLSAKEFLSKNKFFNYDIRFDAVIFNGRDKKSCNWIKNIIWGDEIGF